MSRVEYAALLLRSLAAGLLIGAVFDEPIDRAVLWVALVALVLAEVVGRWERR
jgi:hypothetical protein